MPENVELKARVPKGSSALERALEWCGTEPEIERQRDTYLLVPQGRLKVRRRFRPLAGREFDFRQEPLVRPIEEEWEPFALEWIQYVRADSTQARVSHYTRVAHAVDEPLEEVLSLSMGQRAVVDKIRWFWIHDEVRIHLDQVSGLGHFLEFEAMVQRDSELEEAHTKVRALTNHFSIEPEDREPRSYVDLASADSRGSSVDGAEGPSPCESR